MNGYEVDELQEYIENSNLIEVSDSFKIRLSNELMERYKKGLYSNELSILEKNMNEIKCIGIEYPANAKPVFYVYVVPNENFVSLLNYPEDKAITGGGKPVSCFDLDGFNSAYGVSSNILEVEDMLSIMKTVNNIHELSHLVHGMFFEKNRFISEGFAEALPLYTLNYEEKFLKHRELLKTLKKEQILSAQELIELEENNNFDSDTLISNTSCSFEIAYISSYLFVRGCLEIIEKKFNINRNQATQKFLEIMRQTRCFNQWLVFDIANAIGISQDILLNGKDVQLSVINNLT